MYKRPKFSGDSHKSQKKNFPKKKKKGPYFFYFFAVLNTFFLKNLPGDFTVFFSWDFLKIFFLNFEGGGGGGN